MRRTAKRKSPATLAELPQVAGEVWEGGFRTLSVELSEETGEPYQPELAMWTVAGDGFILGHALALPGNGTGALADLLMEVMRQPAVGKPRRPAALRVSDPEAAERLRELLAPLGVPVEAAETLESWEAAFEQTNAAVSPLAGGYCPQSEEHAEALAGLFGAAAAFYRAAPWRLLDDWRPMGLEVPGMPGPTLGTTVMGSAGENRGLVVYPSLEAMLEFYSVASAADPASLDPGDLPPSMALNFATADEMPEEAVEETRARNWELAAPDAYPLLLSTVPGEGCYIDMSPEPLTVMTIALQAVTRFWQEAEGELRGDQPVVVRELEIDLAGGKLPVRVTCPPVLSEPSRRTRKPARGPRKR